MEVRLVRMWGNSHDQLVADGIPHCRSPVDEKRFLDAELGQA